MLAATDLDPGFGGGDGRIDSTMGGRFNPGLLLGSLPDGRFVMAGSVGGLNSRQFAVARFTADGNPDATFGRRGIAASDTPPAWTWSNAVLAPDGAVVVLGTVSTSDPETGAQRTKDLALWRLDAAGRLDRRFGRDGTVVTDFGRFEEASDAVVLAGG